MSYPHLLDVGTEAPPLKGPDQAPTPLTGDRIRPWSPAMLLSSTLNGLPLPFLEAEMEPLFR